MPPSQTPQPSADRSIRAAVDRGDLAGAATLAIDQYGDEILGYLLATARSPLLAEDAFAHFAEALWRALPGFQWRSSCRTWAYAIARRSLLQVVREHASRAKRQVPLSLAPRLELAVQRTTRRATYDRTTFRGELDRIRRQLDSDERELLVLRIDRELSWKEIAVIREPDLAGDDTGLARRAAALRKQFERLKDQLRDQFRALRRP